MTKVLQNTPGIMKQTKTNILTMILAVTALAASVTYIARYWQGLTVDLQADWAEWQSQYGDIAERSVVAVSAEQETTDIGQIVQNSGSGFIVDPAGFIVTNEHVIHNPGRITVTLADKRKYIAKVIGFDRRDDIAVLKIDADNLPALRIGDTEQLAPGQLVVAMGNPLGTGSDGKAVATYGRINRLNCTLGPGIDRANDRYYDNLIQSGAIVHPGSSGGPLLDKHGLAVGITTAMGRALQSGQAFGFAITLDKNTLEAIEKLKQGRTLSHAFLGVGTAELDDKNQKRLGLNEISGALVTVTLANSPADTAGILPGDFLKMIDGQQIYSPHDLTSYINNCQPGQQIEIKLLRGNTGKSEELTVNAKLTVRDTDKATQPYRRR